MSPSAPGPAPRAAGASLRRRLAMVLGAVGAVLALVMLVGLGALITVRERQHATTVVLYDAVMEANQAYTDLLDAETAVRGYVLTGDRAALEPMSALETRDTDPAVVDRLEDRVGSDHEILAARQRAVDAARTWYEDFALPTVAAVDSGGVAAVSEEEIERGSALFGALREEVEQYDAALEREREEALDDMVRWLVVLEVALAVFALTLLVLGVLLWVFLRRWVTDPLAELAEDARVVAGGNLDHRVDESAPGEVGEVARGVEEMRGRLAALLGDAARTRRELEESHALLREQAEDLSRSNRDLEQFAYVASHDLQEPLRKVASFTQLLAKRYEGQLDERADQYIAFAVDGAKRMQRLINDLLDFSRVGRIGGELAPVDMAAVVGRVTADLDRVIGETGATVTGEDLPLVNGEEPLLVQMVTNLVGNALKFRHPQRAPVVRLQASREGDWWTFTCTDNGIGIDPQYADRVFVIFQRLHAKDVYEGTGIGLALCKKIVEYHGGDIWIGRDLPGRAGDGEGTVVCWTLPAVVHGPGADAAATPARQDALAATGGREDGSDG